MQFNSHSFDSISCQIIIPPQFMLKVEHTKILNSNISIPMPWAQYFIVAFKSCRRLLYAYIECTHSTNTHHKCDWETLLTENKIHREKSIPIIAL